MRRIAATCLLVAAATLAPASRATQTDPVLEIAAARAVPTAAGTLVEIEATLPQEDLVQVPLAVQVLLRSHAGATAYVRVPITGGARAGSFAGLANGLDAGDLPALLADGTPLADARLLRLARRRIELWLPAAAGLAVGEVQLFLVYGDDAILSNAAAVEGIAP